MESFSNLPLELQSEILKNRPDYPSISKKTFDQQLFYKQYCHLDISEHEFINYINNHQPDKFIIYTNSINDEDLPEMITYIFTKNNTYKVDSYMLTIDNIDVEEYSVHIHHYRRDYEDIASFLDELYYTDIYYDIQTTFNILNLRTCQQIDPNYSKNFTIKIIEDKTPVIEVDNLNSFYDLCKKLIYLNTNESIHKNKTIILNFYISNIVFNGLGEIVNDAQYDIIQRMIDYHKPFKQHLFLLVENQFL